MKRPRETTLCLCASCIHFIHASHSHISATTTMSTEPAFDGIKSSCVHLFFFLMCVHQILRRGQTTSEGWMVKERKEKNQCKLQEIAFAFTQNCILQSFEGSDAIIQHSMHSEHQQKTVPNASNRSQCMVFSQVFLPQMTRWSLWKVPSISNELGISRLPILSFDGIMKFKTS